LLQHAVHRFHHGVSAGLSRPWARSPKAFVWLNPSRIRAGETVLGVFAYPLEKVYFTSQTVRVAWS
jgi:hypothetical protein